MARAKDVKKLKDELGFSEAIGELILDLVKISSLQAKQYKTNYVLRRWMSEASLFLVCRLQSSSNIPKIRNRFEKNH